MEEANILTTIVLYHPDEKQLLELLKVCSQSANTHILLFDNAKISDNLKKQLSNTITYFKSSHNVGVGGAHYYACQMAVDKNFDFILLLDQDSQLPSGFVSDMVSGFYRTQKCYPRLAAVGPSRTDPRIPQPKKIRPKYKLEPKLKDKLKNKLNPKLKATLKATLIFKLKYKFDYNLNKLIYVWTLRNLLISSGMLIHVSSLKIIGFPKKEYFIDLVDTEWCLRARAKNYQLAVLEDVWMDHTIGNLKKIRNLNLFYQSPFRYYYTMRNSFLLFSEKQLSFLFRIVILLRNLLELRKIPFVPEPLASFAAAWRGLKEGIRRACQ